MRQSDSGPLLSSRIRSAWHVSTANASTSNEKPDTAPLAWRTTIESLLVTLDDTKRSASFPDEGQLFTLRREPCVITLDESMTTIRLAGTGDETKLKKSGVAADVIKVEWLTVTLRLRTAEPANRNVGTSRIR